MTDASPAERRPLDEAALEDVVAAWRVEVVDELGSTNAAVAERARVGAPEGVVVAAEHQSAGQGRLGRLWESPRYAGLTFSVLLRPPVADRRWPWLPLLTGIAVVEGLAAVGGPPAALKWPNDVLLDGLKVCGVLAERVETSRGPAAVVGIGLNVSQIAEELPVPTATSLALAGFGVPREALLRSVLERLHGRYVAWRAASPRDRYLELCDTVGRSVRVELPGGVLEGTAVDVDEDGALVVASGGRRTAVTAGDVVHLRPASGGPGPAPEPAPWISELVDRTEGPVHVQLSYEHEVSLPVEVFAEHGPGFVAPGHLALSAGLERDLVASAEWYTEHCDWCGELVDANDEPAYEEWVAQLPQLRRRLAEELGPDFEVRDA